MPSVDIIGTTALRFRLMEPEERKGPCVRFKIRFETPDRSMPFVDVYGFRVMKGHVFVPARKTGVGWVDQARLTFEGVETLEGLVREWAESFPAVEFP